MNTKQQEIRERLGSEVLPEVVALIEARNEAGEKLRRLEEAVPEQKKKEAMLQTRLEGLIDEIAELLGKGEDPAKKQIEVRNTQNEIAEAKATILSLEEKFIPEAKVALGQAKDGLKSGTRQAVGPLRDEYEARMAKLIDDGLDYWQAWDEATKGFYEEHKIPLMAGTMDEVPKFHKHSERLSLYIRNVMGFAG